MDGAAENIDVVAERATGAAVVVEQEKTELTNEVNSKALETSTYFEDSSTADEVGSLKIVVRTLHSDPGIEQGPPGNERRDSPERGAAPARLVTAYFFSSCSFRCLAQASAVVCWP